MMANVFVFDKKDLTQRLVAGPEVVLESASVIVLEVSRSSIKQMARSGQSLVVQFAGKERLVIKHFFDKFEGQGNSLTLDENGQLVEVTISESGRLGESLVVSYKPLQQGVVEAAGENSILGKMGIAFDGLSPLGKGLLLGGAALGIFALTQIGSKSGSSKRGGVPAVADTTAPDAPLVKVSTKSDGSLAVTGTAEPGSRVDFTFPDGSKKSVTVGAGGSFSFASDVSQPNGSYRATATDAANNTSKPVTGNFVADPTVDTTAPTAPTGLTAVTEADGKVKVSGNAEPNSLVKVTLPDGTVQEVQADANGSFVLTSDTPQKNGTISVTATDAAGNVSLAATVPFTANNTIDVTAPTAPTGLTAVTEANGRATLKGKAEPNSLVTVTFTDGSQEDVRVSSGGDFTLTSAVAQNTAGNISAVAKDAAGNVSTPATTVFTPSPAPAAPVFAPNEVTDPTTGLVTITGTAPANMKVHLTFPDLTVKEVTSSATGEFSVTSDKPQEAGNFTAVSINDNGRSSAVANGIYEGNPSTVYDLTVGGYIDDVPPGPSGRPEGQQATSKPTNDSTPTLFGTSAGVGVTGKVVIREGGMQVAVAQVDATGKWTATLPTVTDGPHNYTVEVVNALGGSLKSVSTSLTIDTQAPNPPTITAISVTQQGGTTETVLPLSGGSTSDNTPTLSGTAESGSTVILYNMNADGQESEIGRAVATASGAWQYTSMHLPNRKHEIYAKAQDAASNLSGKSNTVSLDIAGPTEAPKNVSVAAIWSVDGAGDIDGDGFDDVASGSYDSTGGSFLGGGVIRAVMRGGPDIVTTDEPSFYNNVSGVWTYHQAGVGDTNGDGFNDIVSMYGSWDSTSNGPARLFLGGANLGPVDLRTTALLGSSTFVASAGDLNGDGLMDIVIGGRGAYGQITPSSIRFGSTGDAGTGAVEQNFAFGAANGVNNDNYRAAFWSGAQYVTSAGDFNGDGIGDIVTARGITFGKTTQGEINRSANLFWKTANSTWVDQAQAVSGIGDANGDGYADVAVQDGKRVYVVFGSPQASSSQGDIRLEAKWLQANNRGFELNTSWVSTQPTTYGDVRGVGDVNGDGLADFVYTTYGNRLNGGPDSDETATKGATPPATPPATPQGDTGNYSNSYIIFGKTGTETIDVKNISGQQGIMIPRGQADGASVAGRIDLNGDGLADIYVGSYSGNGKLYMGGASLGAEPSGTPINGVVMGDQNSNFIVGTASQDTVFGNGGTDIIYTGAGDDTIILNQDNLTQLAAGFNTAAGINGRLARVDGGSGIDTLAFGKDVTTVDLTTISNAGLGTIQTGVGLSRIANVERIDLQGSNKAKLTLELKDVMDMNAGLSTFNKQNFSSGLDDSAIKRHQLVIDGSSENSVEVRNSSEWLTVKAATVYSGGHGYDVYNSVGDNKGQLLIEQTVNVAWS
ncbi:Ig-like domain-containing protein [Pseudomonas aeruginosa]|nr:Ig-like domain-containing protein [Pseudomonas aeruginosa]MCS9424392.1 Ig-like domain-containing protein [Pseudomonas aeruginosa]MCS9550514.1 Ig-like domain-containing protein [Pseudomonas aeruginosa]